MSWLYSRALVEEYSAVNSLDGEQSAQLSGESTPLAFCALDRMTVFSRLSRFGVTFKPLTDDRGEELLTWFLAGFLAKTSARPEKARALTENEAECGSTWRGWLAKYDPDSFSWKTAQCSLIEDSGECLETFPRSGMTRDGLLWELPMSERRTSGTGSGLWPTPTVCGNYNRKGASATSGDGLATAVRMWPTPSCQWLNGGSNSRKASEKRGVESEILNGGSLNPTWVEWLMGWPIGWTDLKPLEMAKFQQWLDSHGASSRGTEKL